MTLEQAYFISQITAAVVVIVSILFLAFQIRQNNYLLQRTAVDDYHKIQNDLSDAVANNREFAEFHLNAGRNFDELDEIDKYRSTELARKNLRMALRVVNERFHGHVSDDDWKEVDTRFAMISSRRNIHAAWKMVRSFYPEPIQQYVDNKFSRKKAS